MPLHPLLAADPPKLDELVPMFMHPCFAYALLIGAGLMLWQVARSALFKGGPSAAWTKGPPDHPGIIGALAIGLGALVVFQKLAPPTHGWHASDDRIYYALVVCLALCVLIAILQLDSALTGRSDARHRVISLLAPFVLGSAIVSLVLWTSLTAGPGNSAFTAALCTVLIAGVACSLMTTSLSALERRGNPFSAAAIVTGLALAVGGALLGSGCVSYGQLATGIALAALGATLVVAFAKNIHLGPLAHALASAMLCALLAAGVRLSEQPPKAALIFPCVPIAGYVVDRFIGKRLPPKAAAAARILASAIVAGVGVAMSVDPTGTSFKS